MQPSPGTWVSLSAHIAQTTEWCWPQLLLSLPLAVPVTVVMPLTTAGVGALHWVAERVWLPEGLDWPRRNFSPREILTPCAGALRQPAGLCKLMAYISHWGKDAIVGLLPLWHFCHSRTFLSLMCWAGFILHAVAITWEWMGFAFLPIIICQHGWNSGH